MDEYTIRPAGAPIHPNQLIKLRGHFQPKGPIPTACTLSLSIVQLYRGANTNTLHESAKLIKVLTYDGALAALFALYIPYNTFLTRQHTTGINE